MLCSPIETTNTTLHYTKYYYINTTVYKLYRQQNYFKSSSVCCFIIRFQDSRHEFLPKTAIWRSEFSVFTLQLFSSMTKDSRYGHFQLKVYLYTMSVTPELYWNCEQWLECFSYRVLFKSPIKTHTKTHYCIEKHTSVPNSKHVNLKPSEKSDWLSVTSFP